MINDYSLGIDVGIGSVGIAVIDNENNRVEYLNSRIFDSSEKEKKKSLCQDRRGTRGVRRNIRRRHHRKERLKFLFEKYGITTQDKLNKWYKNPNSVYEKICALDLQDKYTTRDIYPLRAMAVDYELTNEELAVVLLHICNHRGYRPFYEEEADKSEQKQLSQGRSKVAEIMERDGYKTIGQMYALAPEFKNSVPTQTMYTSVKNSSKGKEEFYLAERSQTENEVKMILDKQREFNKILSKEIEVTSQGEQKKTTVADRIFEIIFSQRDFEDGPDTDDNSKGQKFYGFGKENGGYCTVYKNEKRGIRASLLGDLYAVVNLLSQYSYINKETGEIGIPPEMAKELINTFVWEGELTDKVFKSILKKYNFEFNKNNADSTFKKCNKFTGEVKKKFDENGVSWSDTVGENAVSTETKIHKIAEILAYNVTPKRREKALKSFGLPPEMCKSFGKNFGGTSMVSDKFMIESINAFMDGEAYGDFQAKKYAKKENDSADEDKPVKIPMIEDIDIIKNPVVFRSINETRKMVNAIIEKYGSPSSIHVEVASDLNQSKETASKVAKNQKAREKANDNIRNIIAEKFDLTPNSVSKTEIDRYKLYEEQEGKCMYSGKDIAIEKLFSAEYEIDHIIPFSLILDDTLNNKCLVLRTENQKKGQKTPLQYFADDNKPQEVIDDYLGRVAALAKKTSKIKIDYLKTPDIYQDGLFDKWKSRNINDTRYIAKYVASMLSGIKIKNNGNVIPVKGAITSRFRRFWLVRPNSGLDCYAYIESVLIRLREIEKKLTEAEDEGQKENIERNKQTLIDECVSEAEKQFGFEAEYTKSLIDANMLEKDRDNDLHHGVDAAILACLNNKFIQLALDNNKLYQIWSQNDKPDKKYHIFTRNYEKRKGIIPYYDEYLQKSVNKMSEYFHMKKEVAKSYLLDAGKIPCPVSNLKDQILVRTYDYNEETFKELCSLVYDEEFVNGLQLPLVSRKPRRLLRGEVSDSMPLKLKDKESNYIKSIGTDFAGNENKTVIPDNKYYCVEVYKDKDNNTCVRGIRRSGVVNKNGKLYLTSPYPEGYESHIMYLFKNDYVVIKNKKGEVKIEGYYQSVKNINRGMFWFKNRNISEAVVKQISRNDTVTKYNIDILGQKGGEVKCGARLLSILPKE